jgi:hypothetical protein
MAFIPTASTRLYPIQKPKNSETQPASISKLISMESTAPHLQHEPSDFLPDVQHSTSSIQFMPLNNDPAYHQETHPFIANSSTTRLPIDYLARQIQSIGDSQKSTPKMQRKGTNTQWNGKSTAGPSKKTSTY